MPIDVERAKEFFRGLTREQIDEGNRQNQLEHERQFESFSEAYDRNHCHLCDLPFDQMQKALPCSHWLLRRCNFKKADFPLVYAKYDYHQLAAFLRWCANKEAFLRNINDLESEKRGSRVISSTIRWKNIEWSFDCSENDMRGHGTGHSGFPHYHFQMRIDGRQFINYNDFHIPLSDHDLFNLSLRDEPNVHMGFGSAGSGMQEAVSVPPELIVQHSSPATDEANATYHLSTVMMAGDEPISGQELHDAIEEAKRTNKTFAHVIGERFKGRASIQTIVSPSDAVSDRAPRSRTRGSKSDGS